MKRNIIIFSLVSAVVIGAGVIFVTSQKNTDRSADSMQGMSNMPGMESSDMESSEPVAADTVIMDNLDFQQKTITVKKGTTVTWRNEDTAKHNVVFDDASVGTVEDGKLIDQGEQLQFTFDTVGEFSYSCDPHPFM
ncbi:MAG: plastocyanin/azurin family copper-binding protein, partial [bacterium]|nr:plastocyanin/azurin family copper-binding protein [bacterium]